MNSTNDPKKETRKLKTMRHDPHFLRTLAQVARAERKSQSRLLEDAFWHYLPRLSKVEDEERKKQRAELRSAGLPFNHADDQPVSMAA